MKKSIPIPTIIVIKDGVVAETHVSTPEQCERVFLDILKENVSNFNEYDSDDIAAVLEQGYEKFKNGSINLTWIEIDVFELHF